MKRIKYILLPIVLLFSLFSSTAVHAMDNFSVNMNNVDDIVTFTLTNNSNKNLKDIEYGVKIPKNYKVEYKKNPKYELSSESETTVFKVKISELSDQSSTDSNEMTTYISKQKTVSKLGIVGKVAIGVGVLLVLLVGVLLYRKNKKALIVILIAGLGTQLFPHYTLAADQGRTTEEYSKKVEISGKQVPITLSITYSVEGENSDNPQQKDEKIYKSVLKKYKNAILDRTTKVGDNSINTFVLDDYFKYGEDSRGRDYFNYGFFDIDGNGKDELLLFAEDYSNEENLLYPVDIYTYDEKDNIIRLSPEHIDGPGVKLGISEDGKNFVVERTLFSLDNVYEFYNVIDGSRIEKTDEFYPVSNSNPKMYTRKYPTGNEEKIGQDELNNKYLNKKIASFDKAKRKSIFDYSKQNANRDYTNNQLALIARFLLEPQTLIDDTKFDEWFTMRKEGDDLFTSYGTAASSMKVRKTEDGIEVSKLDYDKPVGQRDYKILKIFTWEDINDQISAEKLQKINGFIERYKKTENYKTSHIDD